MWKLGPATLLLITLFATSAVAVERSYTGTAVIRTISPMRVAVFIDSDADQIVDNGFLLTTDVPAHRRLAVRLDEAELRFTEGYVRVTADKRVFDLQVAGYPESPATPQDKEVVTLIGSAL